MPSHRRQRASPRLTRPGTLASTILDRRARCAKRLTVGDVGHLFAMPKRARFTERSSKAAADADNSSEAARQVPAAMSERAAHAEQRT
eukprot:155634-Pyramimonas_sp.AAC.1